MLPDRCRLVQRPVTQGIVTNATDVKPLLTVATYLDTTTGIEVYQEITGPCRDTLLLLVLSLRLLCVQRYWHVHHHKLPPPIHCSC